MGSTLPELYGLAIPLNRQCVGIRKAAFDVEEVNGLADPSSLREHTPHEISCHRAGLHILHMGVQSCDRKKSLETHG